MESQMYELYEKLDLNNQRNELNSLIVKTDQLLNSLLKEANIPIDINAKNYDITKDSTMTESEMLLFYYKDLWNIKNKVLALLVEKTAGESEYE